MSKDEMKRERRIVMAKMDALNDRAAAGEDVKKELLACGKELSAIGKKVPRVNVMDVDAVPEPKTEKAKRKVRLSKENKLRALDNGIPLGTLRMRVYGLGWDVERAITENSRTWNKADMKGLIVSEYLHLKREGLTDDHIKRKYGITGHALHKFKRSNGMTGVTSREAVK